MSDFFLVFPDEATANEVLYRPADEPTIQPLDEAGQLPTSPQVVANYQNIDVLGTVYSRAPVAGGKEPVAKPGWYVNVRTVEGEDEEALLPYNKEPLSPRRVWA